MPLSRHIVRGSVVAGATAALVLAGPAAFAHNCFIPMHSLKGPVSSNWFVVSAELGAEFVAGFSTECAAQRHAGYAALREARLPVGIKIFEKKTIGEGSSNPNGANDKGLEYFSAGSQLPFQMIGTYIEAASEVSCD